MTRMLDIPCEVECCSRGQHSKGLCVGHYERQRKGLPLDTPLRTYKGKERPVLTEEIEAEEDNDVDKNKTCAWCGKTFFGKSVNVRRGTGYVYFQTHCFTEYNKALEDVIKRLQQN